MSAVYSVEAKLAYDDEQAVVDALNAYIDEHHGNGVEFSLDEYYDKGISRDNLDGLIQYFITDRGFNITGPGEYYSDFNASYGWETVMMEAFEAVAPYLRDGSRFEIYPDYGADIGVVENGEVVWDAAAR